MSTLLREAKILSMLFWISLIDVDFLPTVNAAVGLEQPARINTAPIERRAVIFFALWEISSFTSTPLLQNRIEDFNCPRKDRSIS